MPGASKPATPKHILLHFPGYEPVPAPRRARGYYGTIQVSHEIDTVRLSVEADDPRAEVTVGGVRLASGELGAPVPLSVGRNVFGGAVEAPDSAGRTGFEVRVYRALPQPRWERLVACSPWSPRDSAGELVFGGRLWLFGGFTPKPAADVWSSSDGIAWTRHADIPTTAGIDIPAAFVLSGRMWVADMEGSLYSSPDGAAWTSEPRMPWHGRRHTGAVVLGERVYIMGGVRQGRLLNDVWSSSDGREWTQETEAAPWCGRLVHHTPLALHGRMWLLGGGALGSDYHPFIAWNDVWSSPDGRHWDLVTEHAPWPPRIWGSTAVYRNRLWLLGGFRSEPVWENLGDVWFSEDGRNWRQLPALPTIHHSGSGSSFFDTDDHVWQARHEHSVYVRDDGLYVVGGMVWPLVSDVWRLNITGLTFLTQPPLETYQGAAYEYRAIADLHSGSEPVRYRLAEAPAWLHLDATSGRLWGTPHRAGESAVKLEAIAGRETAIKTFTIDVLPFR